VINARALALETVRAEREAAFDFIRAVRSAYVQYRESTRFVTVSRAGGSGAR
jgi:hypothetical protein